MAANRDDVSANLNEANAGNKDAGANQAGTSGDANAIRAGKDDKPNANAAANTSNSPNVANREDQTTTM